jgi:hypothetical protein
MPMPTKNTEELIKIIRRAQALIDDAATHGDLDELARVNTTFTHLASSAHHKTQALAAEPGGAHTHMCEAAYSYAAAYLTATGREDLV